MITDFNKTIEKIHNYLYANDGLDNYEVLDVLLKIFYLKTYDELNGNQIANSRFEQELLDVTESLFQKIISSYPTLFENDAKFSIKRESLLYILKELKYIQLSGESSDIKGHLMQRIIDRSFREGRGQFFTPAQVVDFVVSMIDPHPGEKGCDPACGTGGFMFSSIEHMTKNGSVSQGIIDSIDFFDISKSVVKLISMRLMFEYSIDKPNIVIQDSIASSFSSAYDFVLTNPPFGSKGRISDKKILCKYQMGQDETGKMFSSQVPDILFVEKVLNILKEGGRAAIVLPDGNFENPSSQYFRKYLIKNAKIDAIVSLPDGTFIPYGTGVKSSIVFFTKQSNPSLDYSVFFGKINSLGYTFSKHSKPLIDRNGNVIEDYTAVLSAYKNKEYDDDNFEVKASEIVNNDFNLSHHFYSPQIEKTIKKYTANSSIHLSDLVVVQAKKTKFDADTVYRYVEISDVSASGCEIINSTEMLGSDLPSRASYKLEKDEIIVAIAGNAIGSIWNTKAIVTEDYENCICTNGFIVLKAKGVSPYLLLHFFNTEAFRAQVQKYRYGTAIPTISREDFLNIVFPDYSDAQKERIIHNMQKAFELKREIKKLLCEEN